MAAEPQRMHAALAKCRLDENSPQSPQDAHGMYIELWPHQLAMLHKCRQIESRYGENKPLEFSESKMTFGVLSSIPSSGKTAVMLALMMSEKKTKGHCGSNLVIVPQGIYSQWLNEIEKFCGNRLTCKPFVEYSDVMELLYTSEGLTEADMLLTTPMYYDSICKACLEANIKLSRVVIDEVDGVNWFLSNFEKKRQNIAANIVWNVSASFHPSMLVTRGVTWQDVIDRMCECDPAFVERSLKLKEADKLIVKCRDDYIQSVLSHVCTREEVLSMNADDFTWLTPVRNPRHVRDGRDAVDVLLANCRDKIATAEKTYQDLSKRRPMSSKLKSEMDVVTERVEHERAVLSKLEMRLADKKEDDESDPPLMSKRDAAMSLLETTGKTIVFSGYPQILGGIADVLQERGIKYGQLDGGNIKSIDKTIAAYKHGDVRILLSDTSTFGRGLNLQETTDIVFLHKMSADVEQQVVGRAQRYGRTTPLKCWYLFNALEMQKDA